MYTKAMLKTKDNCGVCKAIKDNPKLVDEIFNTTYYLKTAGKSLRKVHEANQDKFSYKSLRNHVEKHQAMSEATFTKQHLNRIAKESEKQIIKRAIESKEVFDEVIGQGMQALAEGRLDVSTTHLLKAAELKKNFQLKEQDQQLAMMEMVYHFASGENKESGAYDRRIIEGETAESFDPTQELTDDSERRTAQSRAFYQSLAGDAAPSGSD